MEGARGYPCDVRPVADVALTVSVASHGNDSAVGFKPHRVSGAQGELGDVVFIEIETEGESLVKGDPFGTIEAVKTVSDLYMPLDGEIVEVNPALEETPELVNSAPFGEGWMIRIRLSDPSQLDDLLSADAYAELIG